MAELHCPACSGTLEIDRTTVGDKVACPHCGRVIRVRGKTAEATAPSAAKPPTAKAPPPKAKAKPPVAAPSAVAPPPSATPAESGIVVSPPAHGRKPVAKAHRKRSPLPILIGGLALGFGAVIVLAVILLGRNNVPPADSEPVAAADDPAAVASPPDIENGSADPAKVVPQITPIEDVTINVDEVLLISVQAAVPGVDNAELHYQLGTSAPSGARIQPTTGQLSWQPRRADEGQSFTIPLTVTLADDPTAAAETSFQVRVTASAQPLADLVGRLRQAGAAVREMEDKVDPFMQRACRILNVDGRTVAVAEYSSQEEADTFAELVLTHAETLRADLAQNRLNLRVYRQPRLIAVYYGPADAVAGQLAKAMGEPLFAHATDQVAAASDDSGLGDWRPPTEPVQPIEPGGELPATVDTAPAVAPGFTDDDRASLSALYSDRSLFNVQKYRELRKLFSDKFQRENQTAIQTAWGQDAELLLTWLNESPDLKETLFTAIDPETDDVAAALRLFAEIKSQFPDQIVKYGNLAVAIAVTWDQPRAIYDYQHHQQRAKAELPEGLTGATDQFDYFVKTENFMEGRVQWLPWEFLVHLVNHKTPMEERQWAIQNYLARRMMIGKCYSDVPYDDLMLETGSVQARLNGQDYTLADLREYGGVCAHQADYASRVAQSLGVPAAYVGGESAFGDLHAWVMWVELKSVSAKSIAFTLESHGRYRGDKYYVGNLSDPQSGQRITDRQLEVRLHTVGMNTTAKRQADLVMAAFPMLSDELDFQVNDRFSYLQRTIELCPGCEQAWQGLADMASDETVREKHSKQMTVILNQLFTTFAAFPDFTWTIFDDLIGYETRLKERIKLYERLVAQYLLAQRPDLACEARLRLTDLLEEDERSLEAVQGLAATILAFPEEGRYVPRMLDRIELICQQVDGAAPHLLAFYQNFLPRIPKTRGDRPSSYCMDMYRRGIAMFGRYGQPQAAQVLEAQLRELESGGPR